MNNSSSASIRNSTALQITPNVTTTHSNASRISRPVILLVKPSWGELGTGNLFLDTRFKNHEKPISIFCFFCLRTKTFPTYKTPRMNGIILSLVHSSLLLHYNLIPSLSGMPNTWCLCTEWHGISVLQTGTKNKLSNDLPDCSIHKILIRTLGTPDSCTTTTTLSIRNTFAFSHLTGLTSGDVRNDNSVGGRGWSWHLPAIYASNNRRMRNVNRLQL